MVGRLAMLRHRTLIVEAACAAWEAGNIGRVIADFADDIRYQIHAPPQAPSMLGGGRGRDELLRRLTDYLHNIEVMYYEPLLPLTQLQPDVLRCRVRFVYRHRSRSLEIDGTMRLLWHFGRNDEVARLEAFYDAPAMRAFYDLIENVTA
jgi:hypothetical protein